MVTIRTATAEDVNEIVSLWKRSAGPTALPCGPDEVELLIRRDPEALLIAQIEGQVAGTLIVGWDGWRCNLYRMAVDADHRRSRVATMLVDAAKRRAHSLGAVRLDAIVDLDNHGGIAFWEALGFVHKHNNGRWRSTR
jgi:ribosomal protein S18 acetylase RimI-like enzyme